MSAQSASCRWRPEPAPKHGPELQLAVHAGGQTLVNSQRCERYKCIQKSGAVSQSKPERGMFCKDPFSMMGA